MRLKNIIIIILLILLTIYLISTFNQNKNTEIANPASQKCIQDGHELNIKTNTDGSQTGYCIFENGSECEEWKYFRGECK